MFLFIYLLTFLCFICLFLMFHVSFCISSSFFLPSLLATMKAQGQEIGITYWESPERKCLNECRLPMPEVPDLLENTVNNKSSSNGVVVARKSGDSGGRVSLASLCIAVCVCCATLCTVRDHVSADKNHKA